MINVGTQLREKVLIGQIAELGLLDGEDPEDGEPFWQILEPLSPALG
jgi:hypothetical protein